MKVRVPAKSGLARFLLGPVGRFLVIAAALFTIAVAGVFMYFYERSRHQAARSLRHYSQDLRSAGIRCRRR
jgi:hypothetical protein